MGAGVDHAFVHFRSRDLVCFRCAVPVTNEIAFVVALEASDPNPGRGIDGRCHGGLLCVEESGGATGQSGSSEMTRLRRVSRSRETSRVRFADRGLLRHDLDRCRIEPFASSRLREHRDSNQRVDDLTSDLKRCVSERARRVIGAEDWSQHTGPSPKCLLGLQLLYALLGGVAHALEVAPLDDLLVVVVLRPTDPGSLVADRSVEGLGL